LILYSINSVFKAFSKLKALIIGDVMVDSYIWGDVERISPEAPVPIVSINKQEQRLGGAANVARNVLALGAEPVLCSVIGDDDGGFNFMKILETRGLTPEGIILSKERMTTVKERVLSGSQQLLRVDKESTTPLSGKERKMLLARVEGMLSGVDVIIFEDYDKGVLSRSLITHIIEKAREKGIPTVVDPKKRNFLAYRHSTLFKPNIKEIKEGLKLDFDSRDNASLAWAVGILKEKLNIDIALITRSELGIYIDTAEEKHFIDAHIRSISDVSGAGDTVVSTAALCLALGMPPRIIAGLSNLAGGLVCEYLGVVPINRDQLMEEANKNGLFKH
jgi:rfaE bifunctional protein kinase chain/domain